jgi:hypothetical protein
MSTEEVDPRWAEVPELVEDDALFSEDVEDVDPDGDDIGLSLIAS